MLFLPAIALVVNLRVGGFAFVLGPCGPFKRTLLKIQQSLSLLQPPLVLQPEVMGIYLLSTGTLGLAVWPGVRITHSQGIHPDFYLPHVNVGPRYLPLLLPLHSTLSLHPSQLDECGFFKSLIVGLPFSLNFWQFELLLVLRNTCNSLCGCMKVMKYVYLHLHLDWKSLIIIF